MSSHPSSLFVSVEIDVMQFSKNLILSSPLFGLFFSCRGSGLQDGSLCTDHSHSNWHPHNDLHCHREIPGHCLSPENEEAVLVQTSIQDARYSTFVSRCGCVCLCVQRSLWSVKTLQWIIKSRIYLEHTNSYTTEYVDYYNLIFITVFVKKPFCPKLFDP